MVADWKLKHLTNVLPPLSLAMPVKPCQLMTGRQGGIVVKSRGARHT